MISLCVENVMPTTVGSGTGSTVPGTLELLPGKS